MDKLEPHTHTFSKEERLYRKKEIDHLFQSGQSFYVHPLKVTYLYSESAEPPFARVMFIVPKRNFKLATERNRIRRRMKESYRVQKYELIAFLEKNHCSLAVALFYSSRKETDFASLSLLMHKVIKQFTENKAPVPTFQQ